MKGPLKKECWEIRIWEQTNSEAKKNIGSAIASLVGLRKKEKK